MGLQEYLVRYYFRLVGCRRFWVEISDSIIFFLLSPFNLLASSGSMKAAKELLKEGRKGVEV